MRRLLLALALLGALSFVPASAKAHYPYRPWGGYYGYRYPVYRPYYARPYYAGPRVVLGYRGPGFYGPGYGWGGYGYGGGWGGGYYGYRPGFSVGVGVY